MVNIDEERSQHNIQTTHICTHVLYAQLSGDAPPLEVARVDRAVPARAAGATMQCMNKRITSTYTIASNELYQSNEANLTQRKLTSKQKNNGLPTVRHNN